MRESGADVAGFEPEEEAFGAAAGVEEVDAKVLMSRGRVLGRDMLAVNGSVL
jgi:hypothetical protein